MTRSSCAACCPSRTSCSGSTSRTTRGAGEPGSGVPAPWPRRLPNNPEDARKARSRQPGPILRCPGDPRYLKLCEKRSGKRSTVVVPASGVPELLVRPRGQPAPRGTAVRVPAAACMYVRAVSAGFTASAAVSCHSCQNEPLRLGRSPPLCHTSSAATRCSRAGPTFHAHRTPTAPAPRPRRRSSATTRRSPRTRPSGSGR